MDFPFQPSTTYLPGSTPKIKAADLNSWQKAINTNAWASYSARPQCLLYSLDGLQVQGSLASIHIKDAATGKFRYCAFGFLTITTANLVPAAGAWTVSKWHYIYAVCTNGVGSIEVRPDVNPVVMTPDGVTTLPRPNILSGDETRKYIGAFYVNAAGTIARFVGRDGIYQFLDDLYIVGSNAAGAAGTTLPQSPSITAFAPTIAAQMMVSAVFSVTGGIGDALLTVSFASDMGAGQTVRGPAPGAGVVAITQDVVVIPVLGNSALQWYTSRADCNVRLLCRGWME